MTMMLTTYLASLSPLALLRSLPGACAQGLIWGLLALGVYITYKLLDFADLTVDGSMATGGAVAVMLIRAGMNPWLALIFAFLGRYHRTALPPVHRDHRCVRIALYRSGADPEPGDVFAHHEG